MTSEDIAKIAGVSRSTVSRVINNYPDIPEVTRQKVLKVIEENNYFPNASARKLAGNTKNTIGIFLFNTTPDETPHNIEKSNEHIENINESLVYDNTFFAPFMNAVIDRANRMDYYVLISTIYSKNDYIKLKSTFFEKRIDGGIIIGSNNQDMDHILDVIKKKFKIAIIDVDIKELDKYRAIYINADNFQGSYQMTEYLLSLGHKRVGLITGSLEKLSGEQRLEGYKSALENNNIKVNEKLIYKGNFEEKSGYDGFKALMKLKNPPTAIFVCNDTMAIGAYKAAAELGISIPTDVSITGFDNIQGSANMNPPLTTIDVPLIKMAKESVNLLIKSMESEKPVAIHQLVDISIIKRNSCAPPNPEKL